MINLDLNEVGEWLHESDKYKSILKLNEDIDGSDNEEYSKIENIPNNCYIYDLTDLNPIKLLKIYNSCVYWNREIPNEFFEYSINNKEKVIELFQTKFPDRFCLSLLPILKNHYRETYIEELKSTPDIKIKFKQKESTILLFLITI